jgi:hypothetical protein
MVRKGGFHFLAISSAEWNQRNNPGPAWILSPIAFLLVLLVPAYSRSCPLEIDTKQTPNKPVVSREGCHSSRKHSSKAAPGLATTRAISNSARGVVLSGPSLGSALTDTEVPMPSPRLDRP